MSDYIKHKEYKLPNGRTVTADFNELGCAMVTIQAMDALFDIINSSDAVEVVRCKDCKWFHRIGCTIEISDKSDEPTDNDYCSFGERAE